MYSSGTPRYPTYAYSPSYASYASPSYYGGPHPAYPSPVYATQPHPQTGMPATMPSSGAQITSTGTVLPTPATEESYVENILRMNLGKMATIYMTFENNREWNAKIFKGILEAAGRDHIIISDPATGVRYLLLTINLDYITFDEPLNYQLPFGAARTPPSGE